MYGAHCDQLIHTPAPAHPLPTPLCSNGSEGCSAANQPRTASDQRSRPGAPWNLSAVARPCSACGNPANGTGHAPGAVHVDRGDMDKSPRRLRQGRSVVVMCASGIRSRTAAPHLRGLGWLAASLSGGIGAWLRAGAEIR